MRFPLLSVLPLSLSLFATTTLAANCGGHQHLSHRVFDAVDTYRDACNAAMSSTNGGYGTFEHDGWNVITQVQLSAGHANHCYEAMQQIVDQCFMDGYDSGDWGYDGEWYYMQRFFDEPDKQPGCKTSVGGGKEEGGEIRCDP